MLAADNVADNVSPPFAFVLATQDDYGKYLARLRAIPASLAQVEALLRAGCAAGMLPPLCGMEGVTEQIATVATGCRGHGQEKQEKGSSAMFRPCPASSPPDEKAAKEAEACALLAGPVADAFGSLGRCVEAEYVPCIERTRGSSVACQGLPNGAELYHACLRFHTGSNATAEEVGDPWIAF